MALTPASSSRRAERRISERLRETLPHEVAELFIGGTHTRRFADNLVPALNQEQIAALRSQLAAGAGRELAPTRTGKRPAHAPYSSAALALNAFGPWLGNEEMLRLAGLTGFTEPLEVESKLQIAHGGGVANLDVLLQDSGLVVGVESKLTETLHAHEPVPWRDPYEKPEMGAILDEHWRNVLDLSLSGGWTPAHLGLEQLIKHALALSSRFPVGTRRHLAYVYWEPTDGAAVPEVQAHCEEVRRLVGMLADSDPEFHALSYGELFDEWDEIWNPGHIGQLRARYELALAA